MSVWQRLKAARDFWTNDPTFAAAGRAKARFGAVLVTVLGIVAVVVREWGLAIVCLVAAVVLVLIARSAGSDAARTP